MPKTLIDIPDDLLSSAMHHYDVATKRDAVVLALEDVSRRSVARDLPEVFRTLDLDDETLRRAHR